MSPRYFWPFYFRAFVSVGLAICRWMFAARLFGRHLARAAALSYGRVLHSSGRFYFLTSIFGIVSAPLFARYDLAPPGVPFLSFVLGLVGLATVGLPPSFLLVGGSKLRTLEL